MIDYRLERVKNNYLSVSPEAANMRRVTWDAELAEVAQEYSDQCIFQHGFNFVLEREMFFQK